MLYLAQIEQRNRRLHGSSGKLKILAIRGDNGLWVRHNETIALPLERDRFQEDVLVIVDLNSKRQIINLDLATTEIIHSLCNFSNKVGEIQKQLEDIELWNYSLQYQAAELEKRQDAYQQREAILKHQEITMQKFLEGIREKQRFASNEVKLGELKDVNS